MSGIFELPVTEKIVDAIMHGNIPHGRQNSLAKGMRYQPALFMNCLLRSPIAAKTPGVLLHE